MYNIDYGLSVDLFIAENDFFIECIQNGMNSLSEFADITAINENIQSSINKYIQKVTASLQKAWDKFKMKTATKKDVQFINSNLKKLSRKTNITFTINNYPSYDIIEFKNIKIIPFNYDQMKDNLNSPKEYMNHYYPSFKEKDVWKSMKKNIINNSSNVVCGYNQIVKVVEFETKGFYECRDQIEKDITIINNANTTIESMINVAGAANESTMFYESMILEAPIQGANDDKDKKMTFSNGTSTTDPNDKEKKNKKSNILKAINSYMKVSADIISSKMKIMSRMYYDYYYILEYYIDELGDAENAAKSNGTTQVKL